ncbi:MAG: GNAT family N-acetyltransferase [Spirulina sp.]
MIAYRSHQPNEASAIENLFIFVFSQSEGEREGALIGHLAQQLMSTTDPQNLYGFVAVDGENIVGSIFFSRLTFASNIDVFILAPVAVQTDYQGQGIGQALITHGLQELKSKGVNVVTTYGDPAFYSKVGFRPLSQNVIAAPLALSQPEGWLGQALTQEAIEPIPGRCSCVPALNDPAYW